MEPGRIGSLQLKNRIVKVGATPGFFPWEGGHIQTQAIAYYEALAKGGAGLVTVAGAPLGVPPGIGYRTDDDLFLPGLTKVAEAIASYDCHPFLQLFHLGPMLPPFLVDAGVESVAASALTKSELPVPRFAPPRELNISEIEDIVERFGDQAARAKKAGFRGIELNGACNHLLNSFLSAAWNKRRDAYRGDTLEGRTKIVTDIIKEIKRRNGRDFVVIALINGAEPGLAEGITSEESQEIGKILAAAGADALHVRAEYYFPSQDPLGRDSTHFPELAMYPEIHPVAAAGLDVSRRGAGGWVPLAAAVKKVVPIPVIAVGRLDPALGEKLLRRGAVDFIGFNRRLMADHDLPNKIAEGRFNDILPCTGCLTCFDNAEHVRPPLCQVNAALGKEEYRIKPAEKKKRVVVIGGGPGGMEAARVAALRGHEVLLYEKGHKLGGALALAAVVKGSGREDVVSLIKYFRIQLAKLGVKIHLGREVNLPLLRGLEPDVVILASGGRHFLPEISGLNEPQVVTGSRLQGMVRRFLRFFDPRLLHWLTRLWLPVGKRVVIMGGGIQGCQTAELLVKRNRMVTIVEEGETIGEGLLEVLLRPRLLTWLAEKGVKMITSVRYEEITKQGLVVTTAEGKKLILEADTIITSLPLRPNREIVKEVEAIVPEVYAIGDCREPGLIVNAIGEGARIARAI